MKKNLLLTALLVFTTVFGFSQADKFWSANYESRAAIATDKAVARQSYPKSFRLFNLNFSTLQQELFAVVGKSSKSSTVISLPNADGDIEQFEVFEASNFEPDLQARFPEIRAYSGKGITDKYATLKLSISPQGVQTMVFRTEKDNEFMEPYSKDHTVYSVYRTHRDKGALNWMCSTEERNTFSSLNEKVNNLHITARSTGDLKTMRLAQSCNGEYANYFGATSSAQVGLVLAAYNATLTRCNGVYEKDLALHLNLISNTTSVIYYTPSTDPYTTLSNWNSQLMNTLHTVLGDAAFDIGHMFGASGGGGNAGCIGCICSNTLATGVVANSSTANYKGSGITSPADAIPQGDNFDIDYVVHEVGHQLGANHTFSFKLESAGANKEIGSGITIMGYAGITSQDVAPHSIDIYHEASIAQIQTNFGIKTCLATTVITANNATPVVNAVSNRTIPISTPFALTGSATDANAGDVLTYCWEQNDNSTVSGVNSVASPTKASGPNWLSFSPTVSGIRYCPQLSTILAGGLITGPLPGGDAGTNIEALSSVSRTLNFRLTVRDNVPYHSSAPVRVGQTNFTDMVVTVSNTSGPFAVTSPNSAVSYVAGSTQTITWSVAGTTGAPVSCANVKITLSTDGGLTFPNVLAFSTPNNGSLAVVIPNIPTTTARIKVESVGNIFFDISNTNFTITAPPTCGVPTNLSSSAITTSGATVSWTAASGAVTHAVDYKLSTSSLWISAATATASTSLPITGLAAASTYDWRVRTNCAGGLNSIYVLSQFTTDSIPALTASASNNGPLCTGSTLNLAASASGGIAPYTYSWIGPNGFASTLQNPTFANVGPINSGTYTVTVKDAQSPQATISALTTVTVKAAPTASISPAGPIVVCSNTLPYTFTAVTSADSPSYIWKNNGVVISPAQTSSTLTVSSGGNYSVVISSDGCSTESAIVSLTVKATTTSTLDTGICGTTFTWNGTTYNASGTYTKTLVNSNGCDSIATLILHLSKMTTTFIKTDSICFGSTNGYLAVTVTGGVPPYSYKLGTTGAYQSSNIFRGLKAGNYRVYIVDSIGCTAFTSYMLISQYPKITTTFTKIDASCYGTATGSLTVTAANGLPPYTYRLGTTGSFGTSNTFNNLLAGSYAVYIMDSRNCQVSSGTIVIAQPVAVSATYSATSAICYGTATASLTVNGINGVAPYMYRLGTAGVFSSNNTFSNIKGATYKVYIQDANGCVGSISAVVPQPAAITLSFSKTDISCTSPGSITVIKTGGPSNPPYLYKLNTTVYGPNSTFSVATAGNYYGYIKDSLGCLARTLVIAISAPTGCREIAKAVSGEESKPSSLKVILSPNPSSDRFTLIAHSNNAKPVYIRVLDAEGRNVYSAKGIVDQSLVFGEKLSNGIYSIEVRQGDAVKTVKAVKIRN